MGKKFHELTDRATFKVNERFMTHSKFKMFGYGNFTTTVCVHFMHLLAMGAAETPELVISIGVH